MLLSVESIHRTGNGKLKHFFKYIKRFIFNCYDQSLLVMFTIPRVNQLPVIGEKQNVEPFDLNSKSFGKEQLLFTNT